MAGNLIEGIAGEQAEMVSEPPTNTMTFTCKCGCTAFNCDVETYADFSWRPKLICINCKNWCVPTEPMTNGPH